ncbi:MAG: phenylacetate--CoA ligase family protein [Deltaproteobacteria bacterium]|nr:phenylacetate--CoA ligase family protein [Deltaproteobacteria bacterium]MBW1918917.1 phenylacetate--CoA ligase family protein [Deltaproteobacteria bacterium]MBW1935533.1 phenylacetate--CoA ligase family protein [Deltaproteobacteria bacterium]MBW1977220.1 phenylacetate--CoA ligase family protein [Deltaproteobacteria bacterium]MBW2044358.1 phenylacetate--CoA ligase family protein [Deltaproteobacteria bacterium]
MVSEQKYWNPFLETLPLEKLQALQLKKFRNIFEWAYEHSRFHRSLYEKAGIKPEDIRSIADIKHVPTVEKSMMRDIQRKEPFPYGDALCVPLEEVSEFRQTSGTTGQPVYQPDTWQDWEWWSECWAFILWAQEYRPSDRVFIPFGYNVFVAFWAGHYAAEKIGAEVVPGGVLDTQARILKIQELRCTAMMATPTYVLGMADAARNKLGIDPASLTISKITCAGEPGASIPTTKKRMEEAWGAKVYDHAGATEIGAWSFECESQPGGLHVNEAFFLVEIQDIDTGEYIEEPGKRGKMIITALDRVAQPCIRFDSKDVIEWSPDPCPCGRTFRLIKGGVVGRADDITKVKGVLLSPSAIEEVVRGIDGLGDEFEVVVDKVGDIDRITLKVEIVKGRESERQKIEGVLKDQLRLKTNLGYVLEFHDYGTLPRYDVKAKRFKDLREKH